MKKIISVLTFILVIGVCFVSAQCCSKTSTKKNNSKSSCQQVMSTTEIKAYYFHASRRCATCQAVESVAHEALKEYYGYKISFVSINRETDSDHKLVKKYKISGQTFLIDRKSVV